MPVVAAAVIAAAGGLTAAKIASNASGRAGDLQVGAVNHAADVQGKSAAEALAFQRQQAEAAWRSQEVANKANYDQWAAREQRMGTLGQMVGLGPRNIPGYVPSPDPNLNPGGSPATPGSIPTAPGAPIGTTAASATDPRVAAIVQQVTQGLPPTSQSLDQVIAALNKAGINATRARHGVNGSLASDDKIDFGNGSGIDLINSVGGGNAAWQFNPYGPGIGAPVAAKSPYITTAASLIPAPLTPTAQTAPLTVQPWQPRAPYTIGSMTGY